MLVSAIGYFNSNSKSLYGVEQNKAQSRINSNEGFGNFDNAMLNNNKNTSTFLKNIAGSIQSFISPKTNSSKTYLDLVG